MPVKTWVGRFAIVQGQAQEEGPGLRSFPRQRPDEPEEDELYVLAEPASPGGEEYCSQLVDAVGRLYRQDTLSLTGAMLRALQGAHRQLYDWNQRSLPEQRVGAGVSCLAVRGRTAYLAQIGPAVAYHVGDGRFERIAPAEGALEPLGIAPQAQPTLSRYELSPGDLLVLASARTEELVDEGTLRSMLLQGADRALTELFRLARGEQSFSLVLLACVVEPEGAPERSPRGATAEAAIDVATESPEPPPLESTGAWPGQEAWPAPPEPAAPREPSGPPSATLAVTPPAGLSQPPVRLKGQDAAVRYPPSTGLRAALPRVPPLFVIGVLLLVIVGAAAWCVIPPALQESRESRFATLLSEAQAALDEAQALGGPAQRREALQEAQAKLEEAALIRADDPEVQELRTQVDQALNELNAVFVLPSLELVVDVGAQVAGAGSLDELTIGGGGAYFLDREQGQVIGVTLVAPNPTPIVLLKAGDLVGTEVIGRPQHIVWAEQLGALLVLDDARRLIAATPGQAPRLLTVRDAQAWGSADDIAFADGNLYVLDKANDQVWRYLPTESGFDSEREPLLTAVDLEQVVEIATGESIYFLQDDGVILRLEQDAVRALSQAGIDRVLVSPAALISLPSSGRIFVADRGNKRLVVYATGGEFRRQVVHPTITDLRAIAIDEPGGLLYVQVGGALLRSDLRAIP